MNTVELAKRLFFEGLERFSARDYPSAEHKFREALVLVPDRVSVLANLSAALIKQKKIAQARAFAERAIQLDRLAHEGWLNLGICQHEEAHYEEATQSFAEALRLRPDYKYALGLRSDSEVLGCDWRAYLETTKEVAETVRQGQLVSGPFSFLTISRSLADQLICARTYVASEYPASPSKLVTTERYQHKKIRLAYLSADFHNHATAYLMAELFELHDKEKFEVSAWSFGPDDQGDMRDRLKSSFEQFIDIRDKTDLQVASLLRAQEIDIAVDLKGFTTDCRAGIFAHRAAPIQVSYLGYPGTMGAEYIDYIIGDSHVTPKAHDSCYTEKIVRLPHSYQVNDSRREIASQTPSRAAVKLPDEGFVFCCFNNNYKITPDVFDIWMRLLKKVEGSVLWLLEGNAVASKNLRLEAEKRGVRAERLVFAPRMQLPDHLARHRLADLFLDTLPYNAHTTASDALWAGLRVLTCLGGAFAGRVAASLLHAVGLPELVTQSFEDYEALAYRLATTPALLAGMKAGLAKNKMSHPLFDTDTFRKHIESAFVTMHQRHQQGLTPESFEVEAILPGR